MEMKSEHLKNDKGHREKMMGAITIDAIPHKYSAPSKLQKIISQEYHNLFRFNEVFFFYS